MSMGVMSNALRALPRAALTLRLIFNLPLRQTEGFLNSLFAMMGLDLSAPDHTTLSRRGQHLDVRLRRILSGEVTHLIVNSTGLSIVGEGEWATAGQLRWLSACDCVAAASRSALEGTGS
jgi:hypothetical protein